MKNKLVKFMEAYEAIMKGKEVKCLANDMYYTVGRYKEHGDNTVCMSYVEGFRPTRFRSDISFDSLEIESLWVIMD